MSSHSLRMAVETTGKLEKEIDRPSHLKTPRFLHQEEGRGEEKWLLPTSVC